MPAVIATASNPRPSTCLDLDRWFGMPGANAALDLDVSVTIAGEVTDHCAACGGPVDDDGDRECGHDDAEVVSVVARAPRTLTGEVTLAPGPSGSLAAYGDQPDHWISRALLDELHRLSDAEFRAVCRQIETAAIEAAEKREVVSTSDEAEIEVTAEFPRETETGVCGGIDIDVMVTRGAWSAEGEITLVPDAHRCDTWVSYGDGPDTWVSSDLLGHLRRAFPEYDQLRAVLGKLLDAGRAAIDAAD